MLPSEKQLSSKATTDSFDEIYTNFDLSVEDIYRADTGYPFDYPTRWLNDPSMNKRIAIRRLDATPSTHNFTLRVNAKVDEDLTNVNSGEKKHAEYFTSELVTFDVTEYDNLVRVMNGICNAFSYPAQYKERGGLKFEFDVKTNALYLVFLNSKVEPVPFQILSETDDPADNVELTEFLKFLNQPMTDEHYNLCKQESEQKVFYNVWNRDRLHFHATFSTSRRHFIGKRKDFYQNLTLLYPPPTNESTFFIRFTTNGIQNILLRYCEFDVQLCYIVNYRKATIL